MKPLVPESRRPKAARALRDYRLSTGLSMADFSKLLGMHYKHLSRLEAGQSPIRKATLALAKALAEGCEKVSARA